LRFCRWVLSIISVVHSDAQAIHSPQNLAYSTLGTYSQNFKNAFSFISNQSALSSQRSIVAGAYAERKFALEELNFCVFALSFPAASGGLGLELNYFGFADYNESKIGLGYGRRLGKMVDAGIQLDYHLFHVAGYGNAGTINFEAGIFLHPVEKVTIGLHVFNPVGGKLGKNPGEKLASIYKYGLGYEVSQEACLSLEVIKEEDRPVYAHIAVQYFFDRQFFAGAGIETATASPFGGLGLKWKNIRLDISAEYHPQLGFSPALWFVVFVKSEDKN